ncbi:protein of unknown function [Pseudomonas syringae]|uniref:DUF4926 domain-containing protein n=1 Tax=Pseudomonas syringae TaxID=317 RepID=UPI000899E1FC|nr:DUF4926 domain-containing protein [Pseudomonas syringae]SDW96849.1 protein of unknown function [Pseudomonas syringae]SFM11145.1 protein of unknown function [Pseudomonas syringae]
MEIDINDVVRLEVDLPVEGLARGDIGAVVHKFPGPEIAYEVEFTDAQGRTVAQVPLLHAQVSLIKWR